MPAGHSPFLREGGRGGGIVGRRRRRRRRLHRLLRHLGVHAKACGVQPELEEGVRVDVPMLLTPDLQLEQVGQDVLGTKRDDCKCSLDLPTLTFMRLFGHRDTVAITAVLTLEYPCLYPALWCSLTLHLCEAVKAVRSGDYEHAGASEVGDAGAGEHTRGVGGVQHQPHQQGLRHKGGVGGVLQRRYHIGEKRFLRHQRRPYWAPVEG